jgi:ABC-type sugar transport system ATPase subunit
MVFQNYALYPHMESRMNLGFYFMVRKREKEIPERVKITADIMGVGFGELMERKPKQLSGGQQQRVAIGRCIVRDPSLFLLDEPLSNLDAKLRVRTRVEIKRLLRRFAITTLYVTHDQVEAIALGDRIAVMDKGKVEQIGSYRDVHDRPVNVFVATFIGIPPMNILEATASRDGRELQFGQSSVATPEGWQVTPGAKVLLGVRAEDVAADAAQPDVYVDVDVVEPLVQERMQLVHGLVGDTHFVAKVPGEPEVRRGDRLPLRFQPALVHLFDAATHARLPQA